MNIILLILFAIVGAILCIFVWEILFKKFFDN